MKRWIPPSRSLLLCTLTIVAVTCAPLPLWSQNAKKAKPETEASKEEALEEELQQIRTDIDEVKRRIEELREEISQLRTDSDEDRAARLELMIEITNLEVKLTSLEQAEEQTKRELRRLRARKIETKYAKILEQLTEEERQSRRETIAHFESLLSADLPDEVIPGILFPLANLYYEEDREAFQRKYEIYNEEIERYHEGEISVRPEEPRYDFTRSRRLYKRIIDEYPDFPQIDDAYYGLGYCLYEEGKKEEAHLVFQRLVELYPLSRHVPEAYVRIGEYYFDKGDLDKAIAAYEKVLETTNSTFLDKALYKLGWCHYLKNEYPRAIDRFREAIDFTDLQAGKNALGDNLRTESIEYLAICFTEFGGLEGLKAYFRKIGDRPYYPEVFRRLGDIYFSQAEFEQAITVYRDFLQNFPYDPAAPEVQNRISICFERRFEIPAAVAEKEKITRLYTVDSAWARENINHPEALAKARKLVADTLINIAAYHYNNKNFPEAITHYRRYLTYYPDTKRSYEIRFYLAEALYFSGRYEEAGKEYEIIRDSGKSDKYLREAAFSAVKAYEKAMGENYGKNALSPNARRFIDAMEAHIRLFPDDAKTPQFLYKIGEVNFKAGRYPESRKAFWRLVKQFPNDPLAKEASDYIILSLQEEGDLSQVEQTAVLLSKTLRAREGGSAIDEKFLDTLEKVGHEAAFKRIKQEESKLSPLEAGEAYQAFVQQYPDSDFVPQALFNAGQFYLQAGDLITSSQLFLRLVEEHPSVPFAPDALLLAANNYERMNEIERATRQYERFVQMYRTSPDFQKALLNAGVYREKLGNDNRAIEHYEAYVTRYPSDSLTPTLLFSIGRLHEKLGNDKKAIRAYERLLTRQPNGPRTIEATFRMAKLLERRGERKRAEEKYRRCVKLYGTPTTPTPDVSFAAEALFILNRKLYDQYDRITFKVPQRQQAAQLEKKSKLLAQVLKEYNRVIDYGAIEWVAASFYMIGLAYEDFVNELYDAPRPKGLTPEEEEAYEMALEEQITPLEEKAEANFRKVVELAEKKRLHTPWIEKALQKVRDYEPDYTMAKDEETLFLESDHLFLFPMMKMKP
ncbi:MAG: tetratricopeptide repeat protein [Deltaproteobacteria bacterium]|nr:MAG: tetratricopeptide repeat protein [Deltaproteobacteria bacterium]